MKRFIIFLILSSLLFLSGCWDMREINEIGMVMAVAIDRTGGEEPQYVVTVQIANPSGGGGGGGGGESMGSAGDEVWICSGKGSTIFEAVRDLSKVASRRIMWAHNNLIIIGEKLARNDITPVVDFFTHSPELRMKTWIIVCHGNAKDYINIKIGTGKIPGLEVSKLVSYQGLTATSAPSEMLKVYLDFSRNISYPLMCGAVLTQSETLGGGVSGTQEKQLKLSGAAVFRHSKMIGWLSEEETRGINWINKNIRDTIISVKIPEKENSMVSILIHHVKTNINSKINDERPSFTIMISGTASIVEEDSSIKMGITEYKNKLEKMADNKIEQDIKVGLNRVKEDYKCDVLDFDRIFHIQHKREWKEKYERDWESVFSEVPVIVSVNIDIISSTLNQIPAQSQ